MFGDFFTLNRNECTLWCQPSLGQMAGSENKLPLEHTSCDISYHGRQYKVQQTHGERSLFPSGRCSSQPLAMWTGTEGHSRSNSRSQAVGGWGAWACVRNLTASRVTDTDRAGPSAGQHRTIFQRVSVLHCGCSVLIPGVWPASQSL